MGRQSGGRRGAHRSGPTGDGRLAAATHLLGTTVPRRVRPPRLLNVMLVSGVTVGLVLFGYSTTQIYLRFNDPHGGAGEPAPGATMSPLPSAEPGHPSHGAPDPSRGDTRNTADRRDGDTAVSYRAVEATGGDFTGKITITNSGGGTLDNWVLTLGFSEATVTSAWDAEWQATESGVVVRKPEGENGLAPGESKTVNVTVEGDRQTPECTLNGRSCGL
ncbi:cellulose binding domain-containing protein [Murinocardiopsis flavida]|uniref:Cellulose binding domain-containing protein n=1 Tax=Murinocardiopsis flavida TaxID=645275 RepID=A0A2P8DEG3_9ACTN|nr:cellulose binding domain-containing protein [Murinocardiopsis flavida]PSK95603.1 cellulose binding domain-containing protein [Murinocardiopsis flavida]